VRDDDAQTEHVSSAATGQQPLGRRLGTPRLHLRLIESTSSRARELAAAGAPDGTLVTASEQSAGRGRQGRAWSAPPNSSLLCSLVLREPPPLLSLIAGVAVAETVEAALGWDAGVATGTPPGVARIKWPNDVLVDDRKVAGILVESRPQEDWAVLGIGVNVAVSLAQLPVEVRDRAGTLGLSASAIESVLDELLSRLQRWLVASTESVLDSVRSRDALLGREVDWEDGSGSAAGIDSQGRLLVDSGRGRVALDAGEIHLRV
jgi:BirA family biotin operon repressor/biotin-[acetyl-CoA-carboxylase] ligase